MRGAVVMGGMTRGAGVTRGDEGGGCDGGGRWVGTHLTFGDQNFFLWIHGHGGADANYVLFS